MLARFCRFWLYCPSPFFRLDRPARIISSVMSRFEAMTALESISAARGGRGTNEEWMR